MLNKLLVMLLALLIPLATLADPSRPLIRKQSAFNVDGTLDRLEKALKQNDIKVIERINHARNAEQVGMSLRPMQVLIFGKPEQGTVLIKLNPAIGIDLPMKALAWEDERGQTWLAYPSMEVLARRYGIDPNHDIVRKMSEGLDRLTDAAVRP